jgi:uncharacterized protein YndB with AHSA1/START domain
LGGKVIPKEVKISRTLLVKKSASAIFPYISETRLIQKWNPFVTGDPTVHLEFKGPPSGVDAQWSWRGKKAGIGRATIVAMEMNKRVDLRLDFEKPFHITNFGEYVLTPKGADTEVTWTINETHWIPRLISVFMNLEKMVGAQFEKGLAVLKGVCESDSH